MLARIEVGVRPDLIDSASQTFLRRIELTHPSLRKKIRWARLLKIYWLDLPASREELIPAITEICWDRAIQWVFTGNLMPAAAGKTGGIQDLMQLAPHRPGKFWGVERRFRPGVTDHVGRNLLDAFEVFLGKKMPQGRASSGSLLLLEGTELDEDLVAFLARNTFCNELKETWTFIPEEDLQKSDRFHQERIKYDLPRIVIRGSDQVEKIPIRTLSASELETLSSKKSWALSLAEMKAAQGYFEKRGEDPTDVEMELVAQKWSERNRQKILNAKFHYQEPTKSSSLPNVLSIPGIPGTIDGLLQNTFQETQAKPWILSQKGILAFDEEDAFCLQVESNHPSAVLDPYSGAMTGVIGVTRDVLAHGNGARPIFNTQVFCLPPLDEVQEELIHPRTLLEGLKSGVEDGAGLSGIPVVNGALVFDSKYQGSPLVYFGAGGLISRSSMFVSQGISGDKIIMMGGRIGKDAIHGPALATHMFGDSSPPAAVQLADPLIQGRVTDFLLDAQSRGLYRAVKENGAGGLAESVGELARLTGGASIDVSLAHAKYPGLKPYELLISESQERMTVIVPPEKLDEFSSFAEIRGVEISVLGELNSSGYLEVLYHGQSVGKLNLDFLWNQLPQRELQANWNGHTLISEEPLPASEEAMSSFRSYCGEMLLALLSRPSIASKEWMIRQYDHEVLGQSVVGPLHTIGAGTSSPWSGPNDAAVIKPKISSETGLVIGSGIYPQRSEHDPYWMAQAAVDESIRNILCVGADFGSENSEVILVPNFCWPNPETDSEKAGALVRACFGLKEAALALSVPIFPGKSNLQNGTATLSTLLATAVAKIGDVKQARTADFKSVGDCIYLFGHAELGLLGSELLREKSKKNLDFGQTRAGLPAWKSAQLIFGWLGGSLGKLRSRLRSLHDLSEGGALVAIAESLLARGCGASVRIPRTVNPWEFSFGEGFHTFIATVSPEDRGAVESEWTELNIPFKKIGNVESQERIEIYFEGDERPTLTVPLGQIRSAWLREGYWE